MADIMRVLPELEGLELTSIAALIGPLTDEQGLMFGQGYRGRRKSIATAWVLHAILLLGFAGIHRFYLRSIGLGVVYLLTWGFCGIGLIIDLFLINSMTRSHNAAVAHEMLILVQGSSNQSSTILGNTNHPIKPSFCTDCGKPLAKDDRFCAECGKAY